MNSKFRVIALLVIGFAFMFSNCGGGGSSGGTSEKIMFVSSNGSLEKSIMITDHINSLSNGATAAPRVIKGANTLIDNPEFDAVAADNERNMLYMSDNWDGSILVFHNVDTISGNIAPDRTILPNILGLSEIRGIELDIVNDSLYVAGKDAAFHIYIFNNASTKNGSIAPDATLNLTGIYCISLDQTRDILYVGDLTTQLYVFDNASTLTTGSAVSRTITFSTIMTYSVFVDSATNRLYVASRQASSAGYNLFVFNNASTLSGSQNSDSDSVARMKFDALTNVMIDSADRMYLGYDSGTSVSIYNNASIMSGIINPTPDKEIHGVINSGYGMCYFLQ
jgi:hypothetical protein